MYQVTIFNQWGERLVRRVEVDDKDTTLREVMKEAEHIDYVKSKVDEFVKKYGAGNLKYFWCPNEIPAEVAKIPEPKPEPVYFDTLVNQYSV